MNRLSHCQRCPRLSAYRADQATRYPTYHNRPVAAFGDPAARLLIVGLAPGLHGANASGRPFSGDASGRMLFAALHRFGFASAPASRGPGDAMRLRDCRITNAVKCVPPQNRPSSEEIDTCNAYLRREIANLPDDGLILALGGIAHRSVLKAVDAKQSRYPFAHLAEHRLPGSLRLFDSYHCSRYNVNTGRLTAAMFERVFERIGRVLQ